MAIDEEMDEIIWDSKINLQLHFWGDSVMEFIRCWWFCTGDNNPEITEIGRSEYRLCHWFEEESLEMRLAAHNHEWCEKIINKEEPSFCQDCLDRELELYVSNDEFDRRLLASGIFYQSGIDDGRNGRP